MGRLGQVQSGVTEQGKAWAQGLPGILKESERIFSLTGGNRGIYVKGQRVENLSFPVKNPLLLEESTQRPSVQKEGRRGLADTFLVPFISRSCVSVRTSRVLVSIPFVTLLGIFSLHLLFFLLKCWEMLGR